MTEKIKEKKVWGKLILLAIGWILIILPFASWTNIDGEERLTGFTWALIVGISMIYWALVSKSKWMNDGQEKR